MAKYTEEQLNTCSKEMLITLLLSMQEQMEQGTTESELWEAGRTAFCSE